MIEALRLPVAMLVALKWAPYAFLALYIGYLAFNLLHICFDLLCIVFGVVIYRPTVDFVAFFYRLAATSVAFSYRATKDIISDPLFTVLVFLCIAYEVVTNWYPFTTWYLIERWFPITDPCGVCGRQSTVPCRGCGGMHYCSEQHMTEGFLRHIFQHARDRDAHGPRPQAASSPRNRRQRRRKN
ncbi:hypothetical protein BV25DRAFT_1166262 [Artomyces pyxidatus]|uniref:Uncharacterized protein n=1 Tax=Artomyces pyxidatus TaxID=48021 RepID=A0ACB8SR69_9AGAM|nr:hypothetical protein BV25DRAFT_1166262 [Artomyces pyxidatus]